MVTWEQARQIVDRALRSGWDPSLGEFYVAPWGHTDGEVWEVAYGAAEYVRDGQADYALMDHAIALVDRHTGELTFSTVMADPQRFERMENVGSGHPED